MAEGDRLPRGATVIAITPSAETDWVRAGRELGRRGVRFVGVVVRADSFAPAPSQDEMLHELNLSAIPAFLVKQGDRLGDALSRPFGASAETEGERQPAHAA
jgi:hypothetical protein